MKTFRCGISVLVLCAAVPALADTPVWAHRGPAGGNVYTVVADPLHPSILYAGTERGVFRSTDAGATWAVSGTGLAPTRVQTIAIDPATPSTLYAGTLTPNGVASVGIYKSTDSGGTWSPVDAGIFDPVTGTGPVDVESIAIDPRNPSILIAGSLFSEIFRSVDGGANWQSVTFGGNSLGLQTPSIVFDPTNSSKVYAATSSGLLRSADGGSTWAFAGNAGVPFYALAIDPTAPATLYAGDATGSGIWKSTDSGAHWATANVSLPGATGSRPFITSLAVDPAHPATVYATTFGNGVFVSTNGAGTWAVASSGIRDSRVASITFAPGQSSTLYAGTYGGGVYRSADGAQSWTASNAGLVASLIGAVVPDPFAAGRVFAATSDGVAASSDFGATWADASQGLPTIPVTALVLLSGNGKLLAGTFGGGLFQSSDRGATWAASTSGLSDSYIASLASDPTSPSTVYAGTAHPFTGSNPERIFKSTDGGASWTQTSLSAGGFSIDFITVNPARASQVVAGSAGVGGYFQSVDGGTNWTIVATNVACGGVNSIAFAPAGSTIFLAGTGGVCRSTDGGATWSVAGLAGLGAASILIDPAAPSTVYAGTSPDLSSAAGGVFVSTDGGQSFAPLGAGFASSTVASLAVDASSHTLYAGTIGAGVAELIPVTDRGEIVEPARPPRGTRDVEPRF
jgi:hypothetical protein